jgi:hypothetical protein
VLDYWTDDELEPVTPEISNQHEIEILTEIAAQSLSEIMTESEMLAMLEAIEKAQLTAQQIIAQMDGESHL